MRYARIFILYLQNVFQYRGQIFLWFLIALFHPFIYLLFWSGSSQGFSDITYYYLFFIVAAGLLFIHVEVDAYEDIQQGQLSSFLLKPLSYLSLKFFSEIPWRLIQGTFGLISLLIIFLILKLPPPSLERDQIVVAGLMLIAAYLIMFLFKMIILLSALWFTDIGGLQQLSEMLVVVLAGFIMPIRFFPNAIATIAYATPFPYVFYFPIVAFQGLLKVEEMFSILVTQLIWIILLYLLYRYEWYRGVRRFSGIGQ